MKRIFNAIVAWLGPIGVLTLLIVLAVLVKNVGKSMMASIGKTFEPVQVINADAAILQLKYVGLLKPYKVIVSDFAEESHMFGTKEHKLKYQYKGFAEYVVDLEKLEVHKSEEGEYTISLPALMMEDPRTLPIKWPRLWETDGEDKYFRAHEGEIVDAQIRKDINNAKNREHAKLQAESIIRNMLRPVFNNLESTVNVDDIKFVWAE